MTLCVTMPVGTPKEWAADFKRLNPTVVVVEVLSPTVEQQTTALAMAAAPITEVHSAAAGVWLDLLPGLLAAGATILCPAAWLPFVVGAIKVGVPKIRALIEGQPAKERWTLAEILALDAEVAALPDPRT